MAAQVIQRKATIIADYLGKQLGSRPARPLFVSMQGPQGCGKSSIAASLVDVFKQRGVQCTVASMDDFYLPHAGLRAVAAAHPSNALLQGRGPPGTHDLPLLADTLRQLREGQPAVLPVFDKSAHGGFGDRSAAGLPVEHPDVFVLEGWSLGFGPLRDGEQLEARWEAGEHARRHPLQTLQEIEGKLVDVQDATEGAFDAHVGIRPPELKAVYTWRLEQERKMKDKNGGRGMSDAEVARFVDRYMPVYEVWGDTKVERPALWMTFGRDRKVLAVSEE